VRLEGWAVVMSKRLGLFQRNNPALTAFSSIRGGDQWLQISNRRRAFEARQRGAQAFDSSIKAGWERVAHEWLALADQVELFHRRYGKLDSAEAIPHPSQIVQQQQQQQVQPKKDDDKQK
jgi:hypothetical protein